MATTYSLITSTTVGSGGSSSVTFSSIPQTYQDLAILIYARQSTTDTNVNVTFNSITSGVYDAVIVDNQGSPAPRTFTSNNQTSFGFGLTTHSGYGSNIFSNSKLYLPAYTGSSNKTVSVIGANPTNTNSSNAAYINQIGAVWKQTNAISSITLAAITSFVQYSAFWLYGIKKS